MNRFCNRISKPLLNRRYIASTPVSGFNLVLQKAGTIAAAVSKQQLSRFLQIEGETSYVNYLGKKAQIDLTCCTNSIDRLEKFKSRKEYSGCFHVDYKVALPFRDNSFHMVAFFHPLPKDRVHANPLSTAPFGEEYQCDTAMPTSAVVPPIALSMSNVCDLLTDDGFALVGAPADVWNSQDILGQLEALEKKNEIMMLSIQTIFCGKGCEHMNLTDEQIASSMDPTKIQSKYTKLGSKEAVQDTAAAPVSGSTEFDANANQFAPSDEEFNTSLALNESLPYYLVLVRHK